MSLRASRLVADIAERMGFLLPVGELPDDISCTGWLRVVVPWSGPDGSAGSVEVCAEAQLAQTLACNILAREAGEVSAEDAETALGELANVIAGNLLPQLYGNDHEFHLATPSSQAGCCQGRREAAVEFMEGRLVVSVAATVHNTRLLRRGAQKDDGGR
ncbi:MAG: chemotaxis protein CheX [Planctomycetota bacterium]|nr:chemotaxis protein CheX [Planctomycetota bacterium]MCX8038979.1 chemotaxis protein CheX [Planctomycetota bacterium]MDW8372770.1 chemotaxis protein CheX [Planctomycetota bacterium]